MRSFGVLLIVCGPVLAVMIGHAGGGRFMVFLLALSPLAGVALYVIGTERLKRRRMGGEHPRRGGV